MNSRLSPEHGTGRDYSTRGSLHARSDASNARLEAVVPPASEESRLFRVLPWALLLLFAVLAWTLRAPAMLTRQDDARYLGLARALRIGTYRDIMWPGAPWHHMYPPGYPALLALWTSLFGERFDTLIMLQVTLATAALAFTFLFIRRVQSTGVALLALAMLALSPRFLLRAGQVGSESALALVISIAVWASVCLPRGRKQTAVLTILAIVAPLVRSVGIALPIALALDWMLQRRYRDLAVLLVAGGFIIGSVIAWTLADPHPVAGSSYAGDITAASAAPTKSGVPVVVAKRVVENTVAYLTTSVPVLLEMPTIKGIIVDNVLGSAFFAVALIVGIVRGLRSNRLASLVFLANAAILLVWPYQETRFLVPVLPLLVALVLNGLEGIFGYLSRAAVSRAAMLACAGVLIVTALITDTSTLRATSRCERGHDVPPDICVSPDQASFFRAVIFVRDSLPGSARILSAKSEPLYFYSRHITVPAALRLGLDSASFWSQLKHDGADYILLGALHVSEVRYLAPLLQAHCNALDVVASFPPHTYLYRTVTQAAQPGRACATLADYRRTATVP